MFNVKIFLENLSLDSDIYDSEIVSLMSETLSGSLNDSQIAAWLFYFHSKGVTHSQLYSFAKTVKIFSPTFLSSSVLVDTCGTGGDSANIINVSTLSALVLSSLGIPVAKHGNRGVSSNFGSADILEFLGYPLLETMEQAQERLRKYNFVFLLATNYHSAMKHVAKVRKELGIRTIFNLLGPLCNPANVSIQLVGVYSASVLDLMVHTLKQLGVQYAMVVHSIDNLDEISPVAPTEYRLLKRGVISSGIIQPIIGLSITSLVQIKVENKEDAIKKFCSIVDGSFLPGIENHCFKYCRCMLFIRSIFW